MKKLALSLLSIGFVIPLTVLANKAPFKVAKATDEQNTISLSCSDNVVEGNQYYASISLRTYEEIKGLSLQVYFDNDVLEANYAYNNISANIYDLTVNGDNISASYIFDSIDTTYSQQLFYFYFTVKNGVTSGDYYFDVVVNEAYNNSLTDVDIQTTRKTIHVTNQTQLKSAYAYLTSSSSVYTSIGEEYSFTYYINSYEPSSGEFVIAYDDQLFEFVSFTKLGFFDNMLCDYNANTVGQIRVSFAALNQANDGYLFTVTLKAINNITTTSEVTMNATELYDNDMNPMTFTSQSLSVHVAFDPAFVDHPKMETSYILDTNNKQITLNITLEEDSHLGAGDFVLTFDKTKVTYVSYTKNFSPTFFNVNDKEEQLNQGQVKFSILSTSDIVSAKNVLTLVFSYGESSQIQNIVFGLSGDGLTDSLTNPIQLDISGISFDIAATDFVTRWANIYLYMNDESFNGNGSGRCSSEGLYATAKTELLKLDQYSIDSFSNNLGNRYTDALDRYLAWATACGDATPFEDNGLSGSVARVNNQQNNYILIAIVSLSFVASLSLIVLKQRKR